MKKIAANLGYFGLLALFIGVFLYSVNSEWDLRTQILLYGGAGLVLVGVAFNLGAIRTFFASRTGRYGSVAGASVLLALGILVLLNFLNFRHHRRWDLTENQLFALSDQTQKVLRGLEGDVQVIGFFRRDESAVRFEDLMREYRYHSPRFSFEVVDPQKEPGRASQYEIRRLGQMVVVSGTKHEIVDDVEEEKITNAIIRVTRKGEKTVYLLTGHGERDPESSAGEGFSLAKEAVEKQNYKVATYNLAMEGKLPEDATVLVSVGPKVNFFPNEVPLLKEYLAKGGKLLLLVDPQTNFHMPDFLGEYGLELGENVIVDLSGIGQLFGIGPAAPLVANYADHPITKEMQQIMTFFPLAQSVRVKESPLGYQTSELLTTSERSFGEKNLVGNRASFDEGEDDEGPLHVAAVSTKQVESGENEAGEQADANGDSEESTSRAESRLVLFGDSDFASNAYFRSAANGDLFLNTVAWLAEDTDLIAIRPKNPEDRQVNLTQRQSRLLFWGTVVAFPLLTLVFGIGLWWRRR